MHTDKKQVAKDEGITRRVNRFVQEICVDLCPSAVSVLLLKFSRRFQVEPRFVHAFGRVVKGTGRAA